MAKQDWYPDPVTERWWDGSQWTTQTRMKGHEANDGPIAVNNPHDPASWKADPFTERFWDGQRWTSETRNKPVQNQMSSQTKISTGTSGSSMATPRQFPTQPANTTGPKLRSSTSQSSQRYRAIALISAGVTVSAVAVIIVVGFFLGRGDDSTTRGQDTSTVEVPVGAQRLATNGGFLQPVSDSSIQLSAASCGGLLAKIQATDCLETSIDGKNYALVFFDDGNVVSVNIFQVATSDSSIDARKILSGIVATSSELNSQVSVNAYTVGLISGNAFALLVEERSGNDVTVNLEFIGSDTTNGLTTLAVFNGANMNLAVDFDRVYVSTQRLGNDDASSIVATVYPTNDGWFVVEEVLDLTSLESLLSTRESLLFNSAVDGLGPPALSTTVPPPTTPPTSTTTPRTSGLVSGSLLECDGSWISIVSSQPFRTIESGLKNHPGSSAVKNVDACASLNPYFNDGANIGEPIYVIFYGPFFSRYEAQDYCISLGKTTFSQCYVAPLTNDDSDRSVRYGPTD